MSQNNRCELRASCNTFQIILEEGGILKVSDKKTNLFFFLYSSKKRLWMGAQNKLSARFSVRCPVVRTGLTHPLTRKRVLLPSPLGPRGETHLIAGYGAGGGPSKGQSIGIHHLCPVLEHPEPD
jgi:hypothetical protein